VPELNPSPADLQRVAAAVRQSQLQALLSGPQEGNRSFNALARDLGIRIGVFDPIETADPQAAADPSTYLTVMRRNGAALAQVFAR
jgi:zinc/manganese transport system substrate-binding protein